MEFVHKAGTMAAEIASHPDLERILILSSTPMRSDGALNKLAERLKQRNTTFGFIDLSLIDDNLVIKLEYLGTECVTSVSAMHSYTCSSIDEIMKNASLISGLCLILRKAHAEKIVVEIPEFSLSYNPQIILYIAEVFDPNLVVLSDELEQRSTYAALFPRTKRIIYSNPTN